MYDPTDRRPIAARRLQATVALASWLVGRRVSPNAISIAGMFCALLAGGLLVWAPAHPWLWLAAAILIQARLLANLLDGMVAIGRGLASPLGEVFNEVPDRISDTAILGGCGLAAGLPWLGLAVSLAAMATAYVRVFGKSVGLGSDFCGPMAKQHRMAVLTALCVWCAATPSVLAAPAPEITLFVLLGLTVFTAGRRLWRLVRALRGAGA